MRECASTSKLPSLTSLKILLAASAAGLAWGLVENTASAQAPGQPQTNQMSPPPTATAPLDASLPPPPGATPGTPGTTDPNAAPGGAAVGTAPPPGAVPPAANGTGALDRAAVPEEDDFSSTPYTEYGEFNDDEDEAEQSRFFAHGRFFGLSMGSGLMGATGNRGVVYQGGFPALDLKVHYWFDFNSALDFGFNQTSFYYVGGKSNGRTDVNIFNLFIDFKYYFTTTNISAGVSFANPYVLLGFGSYTKRELNAANLVYDQADTQISPAVGGGLEFALKQKKLYLAFETKFSFPRFKDYLSSNFGSNGVADLSGFFYTLGGTLLFVW